MRIIHAIFQSYMDIHDKYRITPEEGAAVAKALTGLSDSTVSGSYHINWKIGGLCKLDRDEPTNHVHFHNCWEGHVVLSGSGELKDEVGNHTITPGNILVTAPNIKHEIQIQNNQSLSLLWFMFDIQFGEESCSSQDLESRLITNFLENHKSVNRDAMEILSYLSFIRGYKENTNIIDHWVIRILQEMLLFFMDKLCDSTIAIHEPDSNAHEVFQKIMNLTNSNIRQRFSVQDLAIACGMSPRSIQYIFRQSLGITPTEYIAEIKANHAARALLRGIRVQQAGEMIGIPDPSQFSRFFKKHFGIPPVKYRQMSLEQLNFFSTTFEKSGFRKFL